MFVLGTAGHIDHGKSLLVQALTGIDPDRLREEKDRGMTIDLGFAWLKLPSGREVGIVDVPGHERFVKNMLAGAGGIDLVMLVVAADESVMPQTREHFDICRLLGVSAGTVVINKTDLVDPEMIELVIDEVAETTVGSFLEGAEIIPISSKTGEGIDRLKKLVRDKCLNDIDIDPGRSLVPNLRQKSALDAALAGLRLAVEGARQQKTEELIVSDVIAAKNALSLITGDRIDEDVMDEIFGKFCIGK